MSVSSVNTIVISKTALRHNYLLLQHKLGKNVQLLAMVKADAYGHGMEEAARVFSETGCKNFGVAELCEGVRLRKAGICGDIYVFLGFEHQQAALFFEYHLTPVVFDLSSVQKLSAEAVRQKKNIAIHLKVDCGMSRLGVLPTEFEGIVKNIESLPGVKLAGICSHFPRADEPDSSHTQEQFLRFAHLEQDSFHLPTLLKHTANSGGILYFPESNCDMVRAGISLYGYYPDGVSGIEREKGERLQPAMTFVTKVLQVKTVPRGTGVSYGHTYITDKETRLAVLPLGYEDGLSRSLSNCGEVLVRGKRAPICGRICMNLTIIDVTAIDGVVPGDEVVILGKQGQETISGDEIADLMDSISYEVLCLFGNNNERIYSI